jgi:hypothetical protein
MTAQKKPTVTLHAAWPIVLAVLVVVPWLVVGAIYIRRPAEPAREPSPPAIESPRRSAAPGPWGQLSVTPIVISPPLEYVAADWGRDAGPDEWRFPGTTVEVMEAFLSASGLSPDEVRRLRATARPDAGTNGLIVTPGPEIVLGLAPEVRARLYLELAKTPLNFDQANPFRFHGSSTEAWLGSPLISPRTRQLVEPLIYRDGEFLLFSDPEVIRSQVGDLEELRRLAKVLLRQATVLVKLTVTDDSKIDELAEYWGRGGRRTDLRPLLESVSTSAGDHSIDIVHLLPTFARNHLYRYPRLTTADLDKPLLANCLWSSLNFFSARPDDRFLDVSVALNALRRDYYVVEHGFQLGDVVAFLDNRGNIFHVATYLADGLVFNKSGVSPVAPWAVTTIDQLKGYYRSRSSDPRLIVHRRNDL